MDYPNCPKCNSSYVKKNGHIHNKKQKCQCNSCQYQFIEKTKKLIDKLLLKRFSLAGIARVT